MSGYIYCITNSQYEIDDIYKLGYTSNKINKDEVERKLLQRYGTYFINPLIKELFIVNKPIQAEKELFELLKDYNIQNEMFKADYDIEIKPILIHIKNKYNIDNNTIVLPDTQINKLNKKLKTRFNSYSKEPEKLREYFMSNFSKLNKKNMNIFHTIINGDLNLYDASVKHYKSGIIKKSQVMDKKENWKNHIFNILEHKSFDYSDNELIIMLNYMIDIC